MANVMITSNGLREKLEFFVKECLENGIRYHDLLQQVEMEFIMTVLGQNGYNVSKSAQVLGINRNTLSKKIEEFQEFEIFRNHRRFHISR